MATLASNAAIYGAVADALDGLGFTVKKWSGWATRTASHTPARIVTPTSVCIHHTAGNGTKTEYIRDGDPGRNLPGPLTNWHITRDGVVHLLGVGYQNHAGLSYQPNYDKIVAGTASRTSDLQPGADSRAFSANRYMMAVEVNGDGGPDDFTPLQYRAAVALAAECHRVMRWTVPKVGAHKELTRRKPGDPVANMGVFRSDVLAALAKPWGPKPGQVVVYKLGDRLLSKDGNDRGADVAELSRLLTAKGYKVGAPADEFGPAMAAAVRDFQAKAGLKVDGLVGAATVAALTAAPVFEQPPVVEPPVAPQDPTPTPEPPFEQPPVVEPPEAPQDPPPVVDPPVVEPPIVVPPEPEPEPTPEPPKPRTATFKLGVANCQSYDGDRSEKAWKARAKIMAEQGWSVVCASETSRAGREVMLAELVRLTGHKWKVWTLAEKSVCVMWDDSIWSNKSSRTTSYGTPFGHGAVCAPLTDRGTKLGVDVIAGHTRPKSVATSAQKAADVAKGAKLAGSWPAVFAGDFALSSPKLGAGWKRATDKVDTYDKAGTQPIDAAYVKGAIAIGKTSVVNPGGWSDHKWLGVELTLTDPS